MHEAKLDDPKVQKVARAASAHGIHIHPMLFDRDTRTAEEATAAIGCDVAQIVKSLVFEVDGAPVLFLVCPADHPT